MAKVLNLSKNSAELAQEEKDRTVNTVVFLFMAGIIVNIALGVWITRKITLSLSKAVKVAEEVSAGNLTTQVQVTSNDEIGQLLIALKKMTENLNSLISKVQHSGIQITSSTTEMAASRKQLEATLTEQIASTNEVTITAQEISNTSEELVRTMEQVAELAQNTAHAASQSQTDLVQMENTMLEEQSLSARHIRESMEQLSEGSEQTAYSLHETNIVLERLNEAAQILQAEISVFKVKN